MKPWCQDWLRRWPGHCPPSFLLSVFPSKVRERLFSQTPWPLWAPLLRAWIKPFEKEIFYINGQPSNKLLQSSIPNHLVSHGELHPNVSSISSLIPLIILIIRSWHTRQVGSRPGGQGHWTHRRTQEAFQVQRSWPSREWGQLLNTQPEPRRSGTYRVLCIHVTAWPLPCRHHIRLECPNWCVYSSQWDHLPVQHQIMDVQALPSCSVKQAMSNIASGQTLGVDSHSSSLHSICIRSQCSYCIYCIDKDKGIRRGYSQFSCSEIIVGTV